MHVDLSRVAFTIENRTGGAHTTGLSVSGLTGEYRVAVDGKEIGRHSGSAIVQLPISASATSRVELRRQ